jgi:hypothetical protein
MTTRTFREIRSFCLTDSGYRAYYDVPEQSRCTREQWERYYADRGDGTSYRGTVLFGRSQERLAWFLGQGPPHICIIVDIRTFEVVDKNPCNGLGLVISARIAGCGVEVEFTEPFSGPYCQRYCRFEPDSERPFSEEGVIAEVRAYCEEHFLMPAGRYRDMQIEMRCHKRVFPDRYRLHREAVAQENERRHRDMLRRYAGARFITDEEAYRRLDCEGVFDGLNCDMDERLIAAEAFADDYNRSIYNETIRHQKNLLP